jgi:AcrR family transcriptional regulator
MDKTHGDVPRAQKKQLRVRKKERTKQVILAKAEEFFAKKQMDDVSIEDVAEAAFISRTTIYNYFKNKDAIFFAVGNKIFRDLNQRFAAMLDPKMTGKDQVLRFCEQTFKDSTENPIILKITNEYFVHTDKLNIAPEAVMNELIANLGTSNLKKLINKSSTFEEFNLEELFEEPSYIELVIRLMRNGFLWQKAITKGREDKTIQNAMDNGELMEYLSILINGILSEMNLRRTIKDRIGITRDTVISQSLKLINHFLKN